ncbi:hypothetical protein OS127_02985 [Corynebacterium sp. P6129]|uniref:hypothetical protein n=1 Tax=Corynebacterium antarcticum TaxID=2800405 RepID=UPI002260AE39|nr:hypothetical protein [Corynebacterium antarcticum]MCX7491493.1 hypothetical protein [Corynebacterium antarcticum]
MSGGTPVTLTEKITRALAKYGIENHELAREIMNLTSQHYRYNNPLNMRRWQVTHGLRDALLTLAYGPLDPQVDPTYAAILHRDGLIDRHNHLTPKGAGVAAFIDAHETAKAVA